MSYNEEESLVKAQGLVARAICRERGGPACDCRAKDIPCQAPLKNLLHETNPMRYQAIAVVDALIRDPAGRVAALERVAAQLMYIADQRRHRFDAPPEAWQQLWDNLAKLEATK